MLAASLAMTLVAGTAWGYWSADSTPASNGAAAATSVNQGATPSGSVAGSTVTVSWAATTLANGDPVSGYLVKRYDAGTSALQTIGSACTGTITTTSCVESNVPNGSWKYAITPVFATNWQGPESVKSATVTVATDTTAPTNSITLSSVSGGVHLSGTTVWYRGADVGSFRLTNAVVDAGSGPASSQTATLTGTTTGWTHTPSTVSTPSGGPYVSNPFSWTAGTTSGPGEAVTGRDVANNAAVTNLTFANDSTAPGAGTITYANGFASGRSASVSFTTGTDGGSGIATRRLQRAQAALNSDQTCGTFGSFNNIGADGPTSPYVDSSLGSACYMYRYVVRDQVGNQHIATNTNVVKVGYAGAVNATTGLLSHWRLGEATASLVSSDSLNGTTGSALAGRTPDQAGDLWVHDMGTSNETISSLGQAYRNGSAYGVYYTNAVPASADYSVEADLSYKSMLTGEMAGVVGRFDTANNDFYMARWEEADNSWNIVQVDNGVVTWPGFVAEQPDLVAGAVYRIRLEMSGGATTTLRLYVNGVLTVTATDNTAPVFTAAGRAGIMDGDFGAAVAKTSTTGIHFDNFQVNLSTYPRAADSKGTNTGDYKNGPILGQTGALLSDTNTAARFDGVNDHVQVTHTAGHASIGLPVGAATRSVEGWFKTSSGSRQALFAYGTRANTQQFGLLLEAGGTTMTAWGYGSGIDLTFTMPYPLNDGAWHHVVKTFNGTSITIYIDGQALTPQAATRSTVMEMYGFGIGAIIVPGDSKSHSYFNGWIDEVSFYSTTLSQATITDHWELGNAPAPDTAGPTGGSVDATGLVGTGSRYSTSTTLNVALNTGTDSSGVASSGNLLRRATATLNSGNGSCGTLGSYTLVTGGNDPASPYTDTVADQACYSYEYVVFDNLGNSTTYTSPNIKVDTTAPAAPTLAHSAFSNTYWSGSGATVFFRSGAASGSLTTTATGSDVASGIASYAFPAFGTGWTETPGALGVNTYSWSSANPGSPGTKNVTATNNAGLNSANAPITMVPDNAAPSAGTVTYADGSTSGSTVSVSFTTGTDTGSGIGSRLLQRQSAPVTGGTTCGTYGGFTTITNGTNPTSPVADTITAGNCYRYRYVVSDNVGNLDVATSTNVAHTAFGAHWTFDEASGTAADSSGNNHTATLQAGATRTAPGKVGANALSLNGTSTSWASTPAPVIDTSQSYTVTAWVRPNTLTGNQSYVSLDGSAISPFYLQISGGQYRFQATTADSTGASAATATGVAASTNTWAHLAAVHDNDANTISLYVNGVLRGSAAFTTPWKANGATVIGRAMWAGAGVDFVNGAIDHVRLYDRVLSASEVDAMVPTYRATVDGTSGLLNYYRLGEDVISSDAMAGSAGATLQSRNGEIGAAWTRRTGVADGVLTTAGRVRKNGATGGAAYYTSGVPASADYIVEADVFVASNIASDYAGVVGRLDTANANGTFYLARFEQNDVAGQPASLTLYAVVNNTWTWITSVSHPLTAGSTYRLGLSMRGTTIAVQVNGVTQFATVNSQITAAGRGGIGLGMHGSATPTLSDTTGLHLDNVRISPPLADSKGTNHGDYIGGVLLGAGQPGALNRDSNTAAGFDDVNDYGSVTRQIQDDFSIQFWFKSTGGDAGTEGQGWTAYAPLVDANALINNDFGVSLSAGGVVYAGIGDGSGSGSGNTTIRSVAGGYNDGNWHYVVFTRTRATGALRLYVDNAAVVSGTSFNTATLTASPVITFGKQAAGASIRWYGGSLDEIALYNTVLSGTTVADHYSAR